jgi:hypothetical protein
MVRYIAIPSLRRLRTIAIDVASTFANDKLSIKGFATAFERRQIVSFEVSGSW